MLKDLATFLESFKPTRVFKKDKKNLILITDALISPISLRSDIKNILIEENKKSEKSFLLVLRIINKNKVDRIGLLFERENNGIFLTFLPYYLTEEYSFSIYDMVIRIKEPVEFKTVIRGDNIKILLETLNTKYLLVFELMFLTTS